MLKKLDWVHPRMEELGMLLSDPAVVQDQEKWRALMREHSQLEPLDQAVRRYAELEGAQKQARALLDDPDMAEMAKEELAELENRLTATRHEIQLLLLPKDPNAEKTVVFGNSAWRSCSDCQGGNAGTQGQSVYAPSGGPCSNYYYTVSINTCRPPCSDSNCGSQTTDWKCGEYANGTTSDAACWRTKYYCLSDGYTCTSSKENKCVSGYYMSGSTCATCPAGSDGNAAQSIDAATSINDCYVTSGRDHSGTYLFVNGASPYMCNYTE